MIVIILLDNISSFWLIEEKQRNFIKTLNNKPDVETALFEVWT